MKSCLGLQKYDEVATLCFSNVQCARESFRDVAKPQMLTWWPWGDTWNSMLLTSFPVMLMLPFHGPHSEQWSLECCLCCPITRIIEAPIKMHPQESPNPAESKSLEERSRILNVYQTCKVTDHRPGWNSWTRWPQNFNPGTLSVYECTRITVSF